MNSMNRNQQQASIGVTHPSTTTQALLPRYLIAWLVCVAMALGTATNAHADESDFVINEVNIDFTSNTLTIKGEAEDFDFDDEDVDLASDLEVTLGGIGTLGILSVTETEIVAALPAGIPDGDYLLTVTVFVGGDDDDDGLSGRYDLTIGAVGPIGDKGDKGDKGDTGVQGLQGPAGQVGATGVAGPQGPAGSVGATGTAGPQGPVGPEGPSGSFNPPAPTWAIEPSAAAPFTHYQTPNYSVISTDPNSITVQHNGSNNFTHLNITHPTNCTGDISDGSSTLVQKHRSANQNGQGLTGTFCSEGSMMFIQISRPVLDRNDTLWMRCWKTHSNANMCQRAF